MSSQWTSFETSSIVHQQTNSEAQSRTKAAEKVPKLGGKKRPKNPNPKPNQNNNKKTQQSKM